MLDYIKKDDKFILRYIYNNKSYFTGAIIAYKMLIKYNINMYTFKVGDIYPQKISNSTYSTTYFQFEFDEEEQAIKYINELNALIMAYKLTEG